MAEKRIIWVDLEMTGLNLETDHIIEMACLVTDSQLNIVAEGPNLIIHQPKEIMDLMGEWCKEHHGKSGLTAKVLESNIFLGEAEKLMVEFVKKHTPEKVCPLAGNSVHADKRFLDKYMPEFSNHLHYRIIDVSTVKELCKRWYPKEYDNVPKKLGCHRAMQDIVESIKELKFYQKTIFMQV